MTKWTLKWMIDVRDYAIIFVVGALIYLHFALLSQIADLLKLEVQMNHEMCADPD